MANASVKTLPVYLSSATHRRLRIAAAVASTTMTAIAAAAIEDALNTMDQAAKSNTAQPRT